jgi:DNA polymerase III subunit alpha
MTRPFAHLHLHTQYSLLEGAIRIAVPDDAVKAGVGFKVLPEVLKEKGVTACAITDRGNLFGAVEFYKTIKKAGIKPIIGMQANVTEGPCTTQTPGRATNGLSELVLLAQNKEGYGNLSRLSSLGFTVGRQGNVPRLDLDLICQHSAGLICLSGNQYGVVGRPLAQGDEARATTLAQQLAQAFPGRFYLELQNHGLEPQRRLNEALVALAKTLGLPLVGTNDCHYLEREEAYAQYILELMGQQRRVTDAGVTAYVDKQMYLKSPDEMAEALQDFPAEAYENTVAIAEQCSLDLSGGKSYLPKFPTPGEASEEEWFRKTVADGMQRRMEQLEGPYGITAEKREAFWKVYQERLEYELGVILKMKYAGYFLIVADFITYAKDHGIRVGPGRGSGAGSLVAYVMRITELDPIRHGLIFERFLNPERVSLPDFDVDFAVNGRDAVIDYVRDKYGADHVCQISTFGALKAKAALRAVARVLDVPYGQADKIAKLIPNKLNILLAEAIGLEPELKRLEVEGTEQEQKLIKLGKSLELLSSTLSTHAAGVIIMDQPIQDVMPVCTASKPGRKKAAVDGEDGAEAGEAEPLLQTQFSMKWAEDQGAVKFDFLGLLNLDILSHAQALIRRRADPAAQAFDVDTIPLDDGETFKLLAHGDTTGVFQLESGGMRRLTMDLKASSFADIVAVVALYRPGPMQLIPTFVSRKHGREQVDYLHPKLEGILKETYGIMVYQEQVIQAAQILAGYSLGEADLLRRAIGKKIPAEMAAQRNRFITGCAAGNIPDKKANEIFEKIEYFAGYGFNKSHSAAYGLISYQTAYLKANYPVEFMAALLSSDMDNTDKVVNFIADSREMGVQVLPPDIERSGATFTIDGNAIRFGLNAVRNVGLGAAEVIIEARDQQPGKRFVDLATFLRTVDFRRVNKRVLEALIRCGGFDSISPNRAQLIAALDQIVALGLSEQNAQLEGQETLFTLLSDEAETAGLNLELPDVPDFAPKDRLKQEKEALGFFVSGHPMDGFRSELENLTVTSHTLREGDYEDGAQVSVAGIIATLTLRLNKQAEKFAVIRLEDLRGSIEVVVFSRVYAQVAELLKVDEPVLIQGTLAVRDEDISVRADRVMSLSRFRAEHAERLTIRLPEAPPESVLPRLVGVLSKAEGPCCVQLDLPTARGHRVLLDTGVKTVPADTVVEELTELLPGADLRFQYDKASLPVAPTPRSGSGTPRYAPPQEFRDDSAA